MKNKKWKRKAKRLIGECIRRDLKEGCYTCASCRCFDECFLYCGLCEPVSLGIRELEKRFKGDLTGKKHLKLKNSMVRM